MFCHITHLPGNQQHQPSVLNQVKAENGVESNPAPSPAPPPPQQPYQQRQQFQRQPQPPAPAPSPPPAPAPRPAPRGYNQSVPNPYIRRPNPPRQPPANVNARMAQVFNDRVNEEVNARLAKYLQTYQQEEVEQVPETEEQDQTDGFFDHGNEENGENTVDNETNENSESYSVFSTSNVVNIVSSAKYIPHPSPQNQPPQRQLPSSLYKVVLDSGATDTLSAVPELFDSIQYFYKGDIPPPKTPHVVLGDDTTVYPIKGYGTIKYNIGGKIVRQFSYFVPQLGNITLLSVKQHSQYQGNYVHSEDNTVTLAYPSFLLSLANDTEMHAIVTKTSSTQLDYDESKAILSTTPINHTTMLITKAVKKFIPRQKQVSFQQTVKFKPLHNDVILPKRATAQSIGFDIHSSAAVTIQPNTVAKIPTGVSMAIPKGLYCRIASRSGLALKGLSVQGGVVDPDYTGEYFVLLRNHSNQPVTISYQQKIAQLIFEQAATPLIQVVSSLPSTTRNKSGFGSSDKVKIPIEQQQSVPLHPQLPPKASPAKLVNRRQNRPFRPGGTSRTSQFHPSSLARFTTVDIQDLQFMSKMPLQPTVTKEINLSSDTPTAPPSSSSSRVPSSEPDYVTLSRDNLAKAVGFRNTDFLIKNMHQLSNKKLHIQRISKSPFMDPGEAASIRSRNKNKDPLPIPSKYSHTWHIDIGYGPCTGIGGFKYVLLAVDKYSWYKLCYGLKNLTDSLLNAMKRFVRDAGTKPTLIRTDFDKKLMAGKVEKYLVEEKIALESSPPYRQHQNGLVERNWQSLVNMSRNWMTSNLLPSYYWYFALRRACEVGNILPTNHIKGTITTPHELVFRTKVDYRTLFPMFSLAFIKFPPRRQDDGNKWSSKTVKGIVVGCCPRSDGLLFYIPGQKQLISCGKGYKFDPSTPSGPQFNEKFENTFYFTTRASTEAALHCTPTYQQQETVYVATNGNYVQAHVLDIPIDDDNEPYTLQTVETGEIIQELASNIHQSLPQESTESLPSATPTYPWLKNQAKVTMILPTTDNQPKHGFLECNGDQWYFLPGHKQIHPPIPLPNFLQSSPHLINNNKLFKGWISHQRALTARSVRSTSNVLSSLIVKGKVSAKNLDVQKAPSLLHHHKLNQNDRDIWDAAYAAEYKGLENIETWELITDEQYKSMKHLYKGLLPTMAITTIKKDGMGNPLHAKYRIVALGNLDPHSWSKQDCFSPVMSQLELRLLISIAAKKKCIPKSGDICQAFCQSRLPEGENYICIPPPGCFLTPPNTYWKLQKTLYGLKRSPRHFYDLACKLLLQIGMKKHPSSPCLFIGHLIPNEPPLYLGLYVDDFIYFSESKQVEKLFEKRFDKVIDIDWNGEIDYFLGVSFECVKHKDGKLTIHMHQEAFIDHLLKLAKLHEDTVNSVTTPYRKGFPIDAIPKLPESPQQAKLTHYMQSLVGSLNWLSIST